MPTKIERKSRLQFYELVKVDGREFWDIPSELTIEPQEDDVRYTIDEIDLPELISFKFYGDPHMFWIIARRNAIFEWPTGMKTGDTISVPSNRYVTEVLFGNR